MIRIWIIPFLTLVYSGLIAQSGWITVEDIEVEGQRRTREAVIRRELPFAPGDTIQLMNLPEKIKEGERQLMNTGLFNTAEITYADWEGETQKVRLKVAVTETWYLYPVPIFELADRNFNVWWKEQGRSLQRVNIGMEFSHYNFTGWRDKFKVDFKYGYTRSYSISYNLPYINEAGTLGLSGTVSFAQNREINYRTEDNRQLFYSDDDRFLRQRFRAEASLAWRPQLYGQHNLDIGYFQNWIDPLIIQEYNPDYYQNGSNRQRFFRLAYNFGFDFRDVRAYPWEGYYFGGSIEKDGLGLFGDRNALTLRGRYEKYIPFGERWSLGMAARAKYSLIRREQPYNDNRALGFGDDKLHGYEFYIIDGLDALVAKSSLRFELWKGEIEFGKWVFIEAFRKLPFRLNLNLTNDVGISNNPFDRESNLNPLNNRTLWGGAIGLDFIFYYDFVFQVEYQRNDLGEGGIFIDFALGL